MSTRFDANDFYIKMRKRMRLHKILMVVFFVVILGLGVISSVVFSFNDTDYTITVTDKERIYEGSGNTSSSKYLVFGDDENGNSLVFENTDCFIRGKWNSSNIQGQLKEGNTYKVTVVGYRVPFFSMYQNIIKIEEIK